MTPFQVMDLAALDEHEPAAPAAGTSWRGARSSGSHCRARLTSASSYGSIRDHDPAARTDPRRHPPREPPQLPGEAALVCGGDRFTWPEFDDRVNRLANALLADGVGRGDRILWLGQNWFRVLEALLGGGQARRRLLPRELAPDRRRARVRHRRRRCPRRRSGRRRRSATPCAAPRARRDVDGAAGCSTTPPATGATRHSSPRGRRTTPTSTSTRPTPVLHALHRRVRGPPNGALLSHTAVIVQDLVMGSCSEIDRRLRVPELAARCSTSPRS